MAMTVRSPYLPLDVQVMETEAPAPAGVQWWSWEQKYIPTYDQVTGRYVGTIYPHGRVFVASVEEATAVLKKIEGQELTLDTCVLWEPGRTWGIDLVRGGRWTGREDEMVRLLREQEEDSVALARVVEALRPAAEADLSEQGYGSGASHTSLLKEARELRRLAERLGKDEEVRALLIAFALGEAAETEVLPRMYDMRDRDERINWIFEIQLTPRRRTAWLYGVGLILATP